MSTSNEPQEAREPQPRQTTRYERQRPTHRSVEPIDDLAEEDGEHEAVTHESGYTVRGGALSGGAYRRSRAGSKQLRRDLSYSQYLEVPKGRRDIFTSRERQTRIKTVVALIVVLAVLAIVAFALWEYMQANWGSTS